MLKHIFFFYVDTKLIFPNLEEVAQMHSYTHPGSLSNLRMEEVCSSISTVISSRTLKRHGHYDHYCL